MRHRFGRVLRAPFVPWLFATSTLARLPYSVDAPASLLNVHERTGSFATGGLVSASSAATVGGIAVGAAAAGAVVEAA